MRFIVYWKKTEAVRYDLILMDIQMPNMDGYKATKAIRMLPDAVKAKTPVIAKPINVNEPMQTLASVI